MQHPYRGGAFGRRERTAGWGRTTWGTRQPEWVAELRRARGGRRLQD